MVDFASALKVQWPHAKSGVVDAIIEVAEDCFAEFEIDSPLVISHFMAQLSQESGCGRVTRESMNYSAPRIMEIFGVGHHSAKISEKEAEILAHHEEELAERVYGLGNPSKAKELGNTQRGDGFRYRGNGLLQLTGRGSHRRIGSIVGEDLENHPEKLQDAKISFRVACAEFKDLGAVQWAQKDDVRAVTKKINGGTNGLAERTVFLKHWKECLDGIEAPAWKPRAAPDADQPTFMSSKITQAGVGTGVMTTVSTASQLIDKLSTTTDTVKNIGSNTKEIVVIAKPFLGLNSHTWGLIGAVSAGLAIAFVIKVLWERYKKLRDQGV